MGKLHRLKPVAVALLLSFLLSSCLATRRVITRGRGHKQVSGTTPALKVATREDLNAIISRTYDSIHSFQATSVDLTASQGNLFDANIHEYKSFPGVILFNKENNIRIQAFVPVIGNLAFDMVSDGVNFRFQLPSKNLFFQGLNSAPANSPNKIENLRPVAFLSSMLIRPIDPATEYAMLKDDTDEDDALYRLELNVKAADGTLVPGREIWFDRQDLSIARQKMYDQNGMIISDTSYSKWQTYDGVPFPAHIDINRRLEGYGVAVEINKMVINKGISSDKFDLQMPDGYTLREIQ